MRGVVEVLAIVALMAHPLVAAAQSAGGGAPKSPQQQTGGAIGRLGTEQFRSRMENEEMRRRARGDEAGQTDVAAAEEEYGADRVALANQVQALIEEGKCAEARNLANQNGERGMALQVRRTCR